MPALGPGSVGVMAAFLPRPLNILILRRSLLILKLDNFSCTFSCSQKVKPFPKTIFKSASFVVFG